MNALSSYADSVSAGDNDNRARTHIRSQTYGGGGFEQDFTVDPPGLRGLNRLVDKLNALGRSGTIKDFQLGRWKDAAKTVHGILFETERELDAARLAIAL